MRFGIAAGVTALLAMIIAFLPAPVRAEAVGAGEDALEAVASMDKGFAHLHSQLRRKSSGRRDLTSATASPSFRPEGNT